MFTFTSQWLHTQILRFMVEFIILHYESKIQQGAVLLIGLLANFILKILNDGRMTCLSYTKYRRKTIIKFL